MRLSCCNSTLSHSVVIMVGGTCMLRLPVVAESTQSPAAGVLHPHLVLILILPLSTRYWLKDTCEDLPVTLFLLSFYLKKMQCIICCFYCAASSTCVACFLCAGQVLWYMTAWEIKCCSCSKILKHDFKTSLLALCKLQNSIIKRISVPPYRPCLFSFLFQHQCRAARDIHLPFQDFTALPNASLSSASNTVAISFKHFF